MRVKKHFVPMREKLVSEMTAAGHSVAEIQAVLKTDEYGNRVMSPNRIYAIRREVAEAGKADAVVEATTTDGEAA
jgi:hypothetical protein